MREYKKDADRGDPSPGLVVCGVSHKSASLDELAAFIVTPERCVELARRLIERTPAAEAAPLVTCNRCEVYAAGVDPADAGDFARCFVEQLVGERREDDGQVHIHTGADAVRHLMRVACGCESMLPGESQILGQVKNAYVLSRDHRCLGPRLSRMFDFALASAREIRNETGIVGCSDSFPVTALRLAGRLFRNPREKKVLLIGAGEMMELTANQLTARSFGNLTFTGRSPDKARKLAQIASGAAIALDEALANLHEYDMTMSCTASGKPIVTAAHVRAAIRRRRNRAMCLVDMALPRDIDPAVGRLRDVYLLDLNDLAEAARERADEHRDALLRACEKIERQVGRYEEVLKLSAADEFVKAWRDEAGRIESEMLDKADKRLVAGDDPREVAARLSGQLTNKLLHPVTELIRRAVASGDVEVLRCLNDLLRRRDDG